MEQDYIKYLFIVFIMAVIIIYFIISKIIKKILNKANQKVGENKTKKILISLNFLLWFIIFIIICIGVTKIVKYVKKYFDDQIKLEALVMKIEENIKKENGFYNKITSLDYSIDNCKSPYIPGGFTYVEGTWDTGFVIQDKDANQYVWVPCTNKENNEGIEILKNSNFASIVLINHLDCNEYNYEVFLKSSLENGGFYISRFEIGKDGNIPVSKSGYKLWNNITKEEAEKIANNMYQDINSELINGYAYDTALNWIIKNEDIELIKRDTLEIYTGTKAYKNIYDMVDNIYEFSTESFFEEAIYRGIIINGENLEIDELDNRFSCNNEYKNEALGFRIILYR